MGYNTTVVVMNDALESIENDPDFGKNLAHAIRRRAVDKGAIDVPSGPNANAATIIVSQHADWTSVVAVGGNYGEVISTIWNPSSVADKEKILRQVADEMGFVLHRKPQRKRT